MNLLKPVNRNKIDSWIWMIPGYGIVCSQIAWWWWWWWWSILLNIYKKKPNFFFSLSIFVNSMALFFHSLKWWCLCVCVCMCMFELQFYKEKTKLTSNSYMDDDEMKWFATTIKWNDYNGYTHTNTHRQIVCGLHWNKFLI